MKRLWWIWLVFFAGYWAWRLLGIAGPLILVALWVGLAFAVRRAR